MPTIEQARAWYTDSDPVHDFEHVLRVYRMAERLAEAEGADIEIVRAAALLHDAQGSAADSELRGEHQYISADFAAQILSTEGWDAARIAAVQHCIRAHRFRGAETPQTLEAKIIFDADKLDVLGAIGAARVIGYAAQARAPWYYPPSEQFIATGKEIENEPHSAYHEHLFKLRKVRERMFTNSAREVAQERLLYLDEFFERLIDEWHGKR